VILINVDPGYEMKPEDYLPKSEKIFKKLKLSWPNAIAERGFSDTVQAFNQSGYGNIIVDAKGIVRGVNVHGPDLEKLVKNVVE